jgi:hypothetical protein
MHNYRQQGQQGVAAISAYETNANATRTFPAKRPGFKPKATFQA